jgi:hypothetical protein
MGFRPRCPPSSAPLPLPLLRLRFLRFGDAGFRLHRLTGNLRSAPPTRYRFGVRIHPFGLSCRPRRHRTLGRCALVRLVRCTFSARAWARRVYRVSR